MSFPRVVIAGTHSGVGKTSLTVGLMAALKARGRDVQGFKVGPDYIDPTYHTAVTGRPSRNLDRYMLQDQLQQVFCQNAEERWSVIEGVMGMFDGLSGSAGFGSTADIAKVLEAPVILVVDAGSMAGSVAALVHGFRSFDPQVQLAGVVLNRVKSPSHEQILRQALAESGCPVLGAIYQGALIPFSQRHLGLVPVGEHEISEAGIQRLVQNISQALDLDRIESIMQSAPSLTGKRPTRAAKSKFRLGVARDEAFLFYYQDALEALIDAGFELCYFSPLRDLELPEALDGLVFGGGFPELYLAELSANKPMLSAIREFGRAGKPIYAECGGFIYLGEQITNSAGESYAGVGLIPMTAQMTSRLQGMGYRTGAFLEDTFLGPRGTTVRGHEFHYTRVEFTEAVPSAYDLFRNGQFVRQEGYYQENILASYLHLNFAGQPVLVRHWIEWLEKQSGNKKPG